MGLRLEGTRRATLGVRRPVGVVAAGGRTNEKGTILLPLVGGRDERAEHRRFLGPLSYSVRYYNH